MANTLLTLPKGIAVYPALNRPDTRFHDLGAYKANVKVSADDAAPFIKRLQDISKAHTGKALPRAKNSCWEFVLDEDGNETGEVLFKAQAKNRLRKDGKTWDRRPAVIDAKKNDLPTDVQIWGGSTIRVQVEVYEYNQPQKGLNLQPIMVQVIDLVTGGGRADSSAFDDEDGYEAEERDTSSFNDEGSSGSTPETDSGDY
jgi:hypothetical protein